MTANNSASSENEPEVLDPVPQKTLSLTSEDKSEDLCPVCSSPSITSCRSCKKISYCTKLHQKLHWTLHKPDCFPLIHQYDPILGSRLITTRSIKQGEIILREKSLLSGPALRPRLSPSERLKGEKPIIICLGCLTPVKSDYLCPTCSWPACGPACIAKGSLHGEMECETFRSHKVQFPHLDLRKGESELDYYYKYGAITILRGVLLKEKDPQRWKKMVELDTMTFDQNQSVRMPKEFREFCEFCHEFIMTLELSFVALDDLQLVLRVLWSMSIQNSEGIEELRLGFSCHLFPIGRQGSQNCVPNCSWTIQRNNLSSEIHLRALVPIQFGRVITLSYTDTSYGVISRQTKLQESESPSYLCGCERCKDPSEFGTFYSALKCHEHLNPENKEMDTNTPDTEERWLLPSAIIQKSKSVSLPSEENLEDSCNSKEVEIQWKFKCQECGGGKNGIDIYHYEGIVCGIRKEFKDVLEKFYQSFDNSTLNSQLELVHELEKLCDKYSDSVSPNHYVMFEIELEILKTMSTLLKNNVWINYDEKWVLIVIKFVKLGEKWLRVAELLWPGLTWQRGTLLYYYQQGITIRLILSISHIMRPKQHTIDASCTREDCTGIECGNEDKSADLEQSFLKILNIRKEVLQVFCCESDKSRGTFVHEIVNSTPEIRILRAYVSHKSKI